MTIESFTGLIDAIGKQFGQYDNEVTPWAVQREALVGFFSLITAGLDAAFAPDSAPVQIFAQAVDTYTGLTEAIPAHGLSAEDQEIAAGYLNLRFYIYLNGFLQACAESLEKVGYNASLDAAQLVSNSYYTPYFFERVTVTKDDVAGIVQADLERLAEAPRDKKGVVLAFRIRKGVVSTMTESYCPTAPWHYPPVARLGAVQASADPAVIGEIGIQLKIILEILENPV